MYPHRHIDVNPCSFLVNKGLVLVIVHVFVTQPLISAFCSTVKVLFIFE